MNAVLFGRRLLRPVVRLGLVAVVLSGCTRSTELVYVVSDETQKLPAAQQTQMREQLTHLFGTPLHPRLRVATDKAGEDGKPQLVDAVDPQRLHRGAEVYQRNCAGCHGVTGDGKGEAAEYLQPKPRDYRRGMFKFTSTPYGAKPLRRDLIRVIQRGAKGTSMPGFRFLPQEELQEVVDYVIMLSQRGEVERQVVQTIQSDYGPEDRIEEVEFTETLTRLREFWNQAEYQVVLPATAQPKLSDESILAGRKAFLSRGCSKCHGEKGKGQTEWLSREFLAKQQSNPGQQINHDVWGHPAPAADLTAGMLHGGRRPVDIYRRIYSGINGTPMPGFGQALAAEPETIWQLVHYVLAVVDNRTVAGIENVVADPVATGSGN